MQATDGVNLRRQKRIIHVHAFSKKEIQNGQLATPPPSPESLKRKYERENIQDTSSRSTKTLRTVCVGADLTEAPRTEAPRTLAHTFANAGKDEEGLDLLVKDHITLMKREI
jgi:hypothetical protein